MNEAEAKSALVTIPDKLVLMTQQRDALLAELKDSYAERFDHEMDVRDHASERTLRWAELIAKCEGRA